MTITRAAVVPNLDIEKKKTSTTLSRSRAVTTGTVRPRREVRCAGVEAVRTAEKIVLTKIDHRKARADPGLALKKTAESRKTPTSRHLRGNGRRSLVGAKTSSVETVTASATRIDATTTVIKTGRDKATKTTTETAKKVVREETSDTLPPKVKCFTDEFRLQNHSTYLN